MNRLNNNLAVYIKALEDSRLLSFNIVGDDDIHFENRIRIQKYVYLAKYFGLDLGYSHSMYLHGPYSSSLANDYYDLVPDYVPEYIDSTLPTSFKKSEFVDFVRDRDTAWLEVASTLISLHDSFKDRECLLNRTVNMKRHVEKEKIAGILSELESKNLIRFD